MAPILSYHFPLLPDDLWTKEVFPFFHASEFAHFEIACASVKRAGLAEGAALKATLTAFPGVEVAARGRDLPKGFGSWKEVLQFGIINVSMHAGGRCSYNNRGQILMSTFL